jgi:hypothetical protein
VRGNQARLGLPPTAARTAGPFEGSDAPHGALRAMIHAARPHHFPEGHDPLGGWRRFLQLVMDDKRLSANLLLGSWRGSTLVWVLSSLRDLDKVRVCLFLQSKARCMVRREDCGPRREGATAPTGRAGRVVTGGRYSCGPVPWLAACQPAEHPSRCGHAEIICVNPGRIPC